MELIRVTQALGYFQTPELVAWRMRVGNKEANAISKKAMANGSRVHEIIASNNFLADKKDNQEVRNSLLAFLKWKYSVDPRQEEEFINYSEKDRLTDNKIGLIGLPDYFWVGKKTLIDFKCAKEVRPSHFFQLGGYKRLGIPAEILAILTLDPQNAEYEFITNEMLGISVESCVDAFESAFKHYKYYTFLEEKLSDK